MKKTIAVLLVLCLSMALFAGCATTQPQVTTKTQVTTLTSDATTEQSSKESEKKAIKIGFVVNIMNHPYIMALDKFAKEEAARQGVEITVVDPQFDAQKQVDMINQFITQGYDAILTIPVDVNSCLPAYKAAKEAGIPIIEVAANSAGDTFELVTCWVGADQEQEGRRAAEALVKVLPNGGNIVVLQGSLGSSGQIGRDKGFEDYFKDKPQYKILAKQTTDWMRDKAMTVMEDMLTKYPDINALYGHDDIICSGAYEAITAAKREGIVSVAVGAGKDAIALIKAGSLTATVNQPPDFEAITAVQMAIKAINGEKVEKIINDPLEIITAAELSSFTPVW